MLDYTIEPRFKLLDDKIQKTESRLLEDLKRKESSIHSAITMIKADVSKDLSESFMQFKDMGSKINEDNEKFKLDISQKYFNFESDIKYTLESQNKRSIQESTQLYNTINSLQQQIKRMGFQIIDNKDGITVAYTNQNGKIEKGVLKKLIPDNDTIVENQGSLKWNYKLDSKYFDIDDKTHNIKIKPTTQLFLSSGKYLDADRLNNDLNNATYNISSLTQKVENILKKLNTVNGYIASNNFKTDKPSQEQLTEFAINCLSTSENQITKDLIPNGTKIKNTHNQHIWVLNRIISSGLTTLKWEDFGSDNICIASNDGVHGLVTGSQNKFRGYVDINGVISINGLEEELNSIMTATIELTNTVNDLKLKIEKMEK